MLIAQRNLRLVAFRCPLTDSVLKGAVQFFLRLGGRETRTYVTFHIVSTAFLLFFVTRVIDNHWIASLPGEQAGALQVYKASLLLVFLVVVRAASRRVYFMFADAAGWVPALSTGSFFALAAAACWFFIQADRPFGAS